MLGHTVKSCMTVIARWGAIVIIIYLNRVCMLITEPAHHEPVLFMITGGRYGYF